MPGGSPGAQITTLSRKCDEVSPLAYAGSSHCANCASGNKYIGRTGSFIPQVMYRMSFTTPTISYIAEYLILPGPKCCPIGFWSLKNFFTNASLITATFRVAAVSSSVNGRPSTILEPIVSKKSGVTRANPEPVSSFGGGSGRPSMRTPLFQLSPDIGA